MRCRLDRQLTAIVLALVFRIVLLGLFYIIFSLYMLNLPMSENNRLEVAIASLVTAIAHSSLYMNFAVRCTVVLF